jgi:hypothetical protein
MKIFSFLLLFISFFANAQIGINTTVPQGTLDVVTTNNTGLVLPRVTSLDLVTDGAGGPPVNGTSVYDLSRNAICFYQNNSWTCIEIDANGAPVLVDSTPLLTFDACNYIKASNTGIADQFGNSVSISGDGNTLAVSAVGEDSNATGVNGNQFDNSSTNSGAVYVYARSAGVWSQQAYIKASNTQGGDQFGDSVILSEDGNTLAVGASNEDSADTGINGNQTNNTASGSGAVYIFSRLANVWSQQAYIKASNTGAGDFFGRQVSLSADGNTLAVGAVGEDSNTTGVNGNQFDNSSQYSGAVYVYSRLAGAWSQQAYIKASNTEINDSFGFSVSLSGDGNTLAVGANAEDSATNGVNGNEADNTASNAGAVYVFSRSAGVWSQQAYIKAFNTETLDFFGGSVGLSGDGNTLAVGAYGESSNATGVNGNTADNSAGSSGAVYVYNRLAGIWSQQAYIKASNTGSGDNFGRYLALSRSGNILAVGATGEDSNATGVNGNEADNSAINAGAAYVFKKNGTVWLQQAYNKASNTDGGDLFGCAVAISENENTLAVGAVVEDSNATGVNGNEANNTAGVSGAVYVCDK